MDVASIFGGLPITEFIGLIFAGVGVAALGTLIGAGGGIIFVPLFLYMFPDWTPAQIVGTSLFVVMCNAISGSVAYVSRRRFCTAPRFSLVSPHSQGLIWALLHLVISMKIASAYGSACSCYVCPASLASRI